ncbi:MAG: dTDP-4-amino-4,6-dideoxygalactose transaminase, partial [Bdellovibrionales bacterium]|nr:dTDP-4-amino-4,6-dideoxygalactose transaminase [Bdellovibrionales bacterium]
MIPFNRASILGNELAYIRRAVQSGVISGEGTFVDACGRALQHLLRTDAPVLLTPSCTDALELAAIVANIGEGDDVIMPSFTFVSTATAFCRRGARPVFADVDPQFLNLDPQDVSVALTPQTKGIVPVHYGGVGCDMQALQQIATASGALLIEDSAHALGVPTRDKCLGTLGALGAFSFHETKNVTCGEGGALVVNDERFVDRAYVVRDKGTNRRTFLRGDEPFYTWVDEGSSYVMSDILAAFLLAQLEHLDETTRRRREIHARYSQGLSMLRGTGAITFPDVPLEDSSAHLFFILLNDAGTRARLQQHLRDRGIHAVFHYQPLHRSPYVEARWG